MKVLVTGDRNWVEQRPIEDRLRKIRLLNRGRPLILVAGGATGVDAIAAYVARQEGFEVREYPVSDFEWKLQGRKAGVLRNQRMLDEEHPDKNGAGFDLCLAWHLDPNLGRGTRDMIARVRALKRPIQVVEIYTGKACVRSQ